MLQLVDQKFLDGVADEARKSPRLRKNFNFHSDLNEKCQRMLNVLEPGTDMPIHRHKIAEMYIVLQGKLRVMTYDDDKNELESVVLNPNEGNFGVQIPANTWHSLEVLAADTVIFEVKEGPYIPLDENNILR